MPPSSTIEERERAIVEEFALFDDWMGKYEYLIEQADAMPIVSEEYKTDAHKIKGCQAQVWVRAEYKGGLMHYAGDSDAKITKGLVALLIRVLDNQPPAAIAEANLDFLDKVGMKEHLSPNRKNGLAAMIKQMKLRALAHDNSA